MTPRAPGQGPSVPSPLDEYRSPSARAGRGEASLDAPGHDGRGSGTGAAEPGEARVPLTGSKRPSAGLRLTLAAVLFLVWFAAMGFGGPTFGKISEVSSNDQATFLPASAESTLASEEAAKFREGEAIPAVVVGEAQLDPRADAPAVEALTGALKDVEGVQEVVGPIPSEDGEAVQLIALVDTSDGAPELDSVVEELRTVLTETTADDAAVQDSSLADTQWHVTGPAGLASDLGGAFAGIDGILLAVALIVVFVILVIVYRSILLPVVVLLTAMGGLCAAIVAVYWMATWDWIQLNGQSQGILSILVIGAATDYCLLLVARYREELLVREHVFDALAAAVRGSFGAITASASTVAIALLCLLFSDLNSNRSLGPIAASGILFAWLAALTMLPAILQLLGRAAFWPNIPSPANARARKEKLAAKGRSYRQPEDTEGRPIAGLEEDHGIWTRSAAFVARHARAVWIVTAAVLLAVAAGITQLNASGVSQTDVILGESDAKAGQAVLSDHFAAGSGSPANIVVPADGRDRVQEILEGTDGVAEVQLEAEGGAPADTPPMNLPPLEVDGEVLFSVTLADPAESLEAQQTIETIRAELQDVPGDTLVGGTAAEALDTNDTAQRDLQVIIPLVLVVVLLILMVLLRSVLAAVLLVVATVISFGTAMGVSALVFNHVLEYPGADPTVPLYGFVFLVALGVDYTIFLMTRAREEVDAVGTRAGVLKALTVTGGVITSAGVVLAATFAALAVIPLMFMVQLGFIVAFGVLLDTLVVRTLLIPALVRDIGPKVWWPARAA